MTISNWGYRKLQDDCGGFDRFSFCSQGVRGPRAIAGRWDDQCRARFSEVATRCLLASPETQEIRRDGRIRFTRCPTLWTLPCRDRLPRSLGVQALQKGHNGVTGLPDAPESFPPDGAGVERPVFGQETRGEQCCTVLRALADADVASDLPMVHPLKDLERLSRYAAEPHQLLDSSEHLSGHGKPGIGVSVVVWRYLRQVHMESPRCETGDGFPYGVHSLRDEAAVLGAESQPNVGLKAGDIGQLAVRFDGVAESPGYSAQLVVDLQWAVDADADHDSRHPQTDDLPGHLRDTRWLHAVCREMHKHQIRAILNERGHNLREIIPFGWFAAGEINPGQESRVVREPPDLVERELITWLCLPDPAIAAS
jgi:hypothetical protein